jgi:hypothetical protein
MRIEQDATVSNSGCASLVQGTDKIVADAIRSDLVSARWSLATDKGRQVLQLELRDDVTGRTESEVFLPSEVGDRDEMFKRVKRVYGKLLQSGSA